MARECGRQRYWREVREIADDEGVEIPEARRLWRARTQRGAAARIARAGRAAIMLAVSTLRPRSVSDAEAATICPFCRDVMPETTVEPCTQTHTCLGCGTRYHADCWSEAGCAILGCRGRIAREERQIRATIREDTESPRRPTTVLEFALALGLALAALILVLGAYATIFWIIGGRS